MTTNVEVFDTLRRELTVVAPLAAEAVRTPLQPLLRGVDALWRAMATTRRHLLALDVHRDNWESADVGDFYMLASMVYAGTATDMVCTACRAHLPSHWAACPFCGGTKRRAAPMPRGVITEEKARQLGFIDTGAYPAPARALGAPVVDPGKKRQHHGAGLRNLPKEARALLKWIRRADVAWRFPFSVEQLTVQPMKNLRTIARLCRDWEAESGLVAFSQRDMVTWIMAHQPPAPVSPGPLPYGSLIFDEDDGDDVGA